MLIISNTSFIKLYLRKFRVPEAEAMHIASVWWEGDARTQ